MFARMKEDIETIFERDPAARSKLEVVLCYPGFHALAIHRGAHWCWLQGWTFMGRWLSQVGRFSKRGLRFIRPPVSEDGCLSTTAWGW